MHDSPLKTQGPRDRLQQTIARAVEMTGVAFFSNADVWMRFLPAADGSGIVFCRTDLPDQTRIPATVEFARPMHRRTAIVRGEASVAMIEHVMAALAGLGIDNVTVEIDGPEPPGFDGSCRRLADALLEAGIVELSTPVHPLIVEQKVSVRQEETTAEVSAQPAMDGSTRFSYELDYGPTSPVPAAIATFAASPEVFISEIAPARTFVLESEVAALKKLGYGQRLTTRDLIVYGTAGVIDNKLHWPDECARHKILDCLGDLALTGRPIQGLVSCRRSGHELNQRLAAKLLFVEETQAAKATPRAA